MSRTAKRRTPRDRLSRPRARKWTRIVEAATLARASGDVDDARRAFASLRESEQMQLATELATTRHAELTRAFADVIAVSAGYRLKDADGARDVRPEVCVRMVVKAKRKQVRAQHRVPAELFAYWTLEGARVLCAVPTDVEDGRRLAEIHAQGQIAAVAPGTTGEPIHGVIACAIQRNGEPPVYAIGCRHVFGRALSSDAHVYHGAEIRPAGEPKVIAVATPLAGALANGIEHSFDSQLARVQDLGLLRDALGAIRYDTRPLAGWSELTAHAEYWILTPHRPVRARYAGVYTEPIRYTPWLHDVRHAMLARFHLDTPTIEGDSGSPVMTSPSGGRLVGMHIAGNATDTSLVIPAWQLLYPPSYGTGPETWALWPNP
jgi:hypothetical protein